MDIEEINMHKKNAKKIPVKVGDSLENALNTLVKLRKIGEYEWYIDFNGHLFYSVDIDFERDYISYMGCTPEEHEKKLEEIRKKEIEIQRLAEETAQAKLSERVLEGSKYISIYKKDAWAELVNDLSIKGKDWNHALDTAIKYLMLLDSDNMDVKEVANMYVEEFKSDIGDWYTSGILSIIACYSDKGPEFDLSVSEIAREVTGRKICNHKKYAKRLTDINKLNDLNVQYEEAKCLVDCDMYNYTIDDIRVKAIEIGDSEFIGIDTTGNLVLSEFIDHRFVTFVIDEEKIIRVITDMDDDYSLITNDDKQEILKDTIVKLIKLRRNLNELAYIHNRIKELILNNTSILTKEIMARRELRELNNPISSSSSIKLIDAIMNIEDNKQRKLNINN